MATLAPPLAFSRGVGASSNVYGDGTKAHECQLPGKALAWPNARSWPTAVELGLLHGFTCLFALIGELFTDYRIYAFPNSGGFYDLGFVIGAIAAFGGSAAAA